MLDGCNERPPQLRAISSRQTQSYNLIHGTETSFSQFGFRIWVKILYDPTNCRYLFGVVASLCVSHTQIFPRTARTYLWTQAAGGHAGIVSNETDLALSLGLLWRHRQFPVRAEKFLYGCVDGFLPLLN